MGVVLWKPLYFMSIALFALSAILFPISSKWSILTIFMLVVLWSRIPGFVNLVFNKLALNDLFSFIVTMNLGGLAGGTFGAFSMIFSRIVGPDEWWPFTARYSAAMFLAGIMSPFIIHAVGVTGMAAYFWFEGILYSIYYILVLLFARDEIPLEIGLLPAVFFFDFVMNAALVRIFGNTVSNMLTKGLSSGWPIIIFAGLILAFFVISKNGKRIGSKLEPLWNKIVKKPDFGQKKEKEITWDDLRAHEVPISLAPHKPQQKQVHASQEKEEPKKDEIKEKVERFEKKKKESRGFLTSILRKIGT